MYKRIDLLVRDGALPHQAFLEAWRDEYVPAMWTSDHVRRYHRVLPTDPEHAEFDGLSEVYVEDPAHAAPGGPLEDVAEVLPVAEHQQFLGEVTVQRDDVGGNLDGLYKHSAFLVRKQGMGHDAFVDYWQTNHTPIAREIEGVVRYDTVLPHDPAAAAFDGVAELYFEDLEALHDALGSEGSRDYDPEKGKAREARQDVDNFLAVDERPRLIGVNHVVKAEGEDQPGAGSSGPGED